MHKPIAVFNDPERYIQFLTSPNLERMYGQHYDWKEIPKPYNKDTAKKGIIECVSAFANSNPDGGIIILGINDKKQTITGTEHLTEEQLNSLLSLPNQLLRNQSCQSKPLTIEGHRVYLILVAYEERNICHTTSNPNEAWKRNGAQNEPFKREDWEYFKNRKNPGLWEMQPCTRYEERFLDKPLFEEFKVGWLADSDMANNFDIIDILENAGAIIKHQEEWWFTNAGYLFFCSNPQRLFPSAYIRFLKYEAKLQDKPNPGNTVGEHEFKGALPTMIRKIRDWVKDSSWFRRYTYRANEGFSFIHEDEYPIIAIGEAIVNAVAHRDYALQIPIDCLSYTDAFQVRNGGGILQGQSTLPNKFLLGAHIIRSYPRNSRLVSWFKTLKDEDKPFVLSRGEGTRRIEIEVQKLGLPMPEYQTNGETILTFQNNIKERSKRFFSDNAPSYSASEYFNLFAINFQGHVEAYDKKVLLKEIMGVLKDNLQANGWYVDRYSKGRLTVHQRGATFPLGNPTVEKICSIFRASVLQIKTIDGRFYLAIDYKAELKNRQSIAQLGDDIQKNLLNKTGISKYHGNWENCIIRFVGKEASDVYLIDFDTEVKVENTAIYPNLSIEQFEQNLSNQSIRFDLQSKLKEASLLTLPNAAIERARLTLLAAQAIASITPLKFNGFHFSVNPQPVFLLNSPTIKSEEINISALTVFHDLQEPKVSFANKYQSINILDGLNKFGSYANEARNVTIIPVCTISEREQMAALIERLQIGKYKYEGSQRTFGVKFIYETIYTTASYKDIEAECKRIVQQHPSWEGDSSLSRIFLVSMPERKFPLDDHTSPYYGVKEYLFERGIPCQMVNTPTLANPDWKDLNLSLNMVAKCGLVPWVLSEKLPEADFFMGIAYTTTRNSKNREKLMGFVSVFDEYGRWRFYKGESVFSFEKKQEYFAKLIPETLKELGHLSDNAKIHIHTASRFSREDKRVILSAAKDVLPNAQFSFVWINDTHILRGYDDSNVGGSLSRGSYVSLSPREVLLSTTGYNTLKKSLGTPRMIDAVIHSESSIDLKLYAKHLLALTKLNWASTNALTGEPITTKYALHIAYLTEKFIQRKGGFKLHKVLEKTPWFI